MAPNQIFTRRKIDSKLVKGSAEMKGKRGGEGGAAATPCMP